MIRRYHLVKDLYSTELFMKHCHYCPVKVDK